jgi:hypothetical protein
MDNPWPRREPEPPSRATPEALYSGTASGCTFSPRIRTSITGGPNLQNTGLAFTRNLLLKKVSPEPAHKPGNTVRTAVHREWCVLHTRPCGTHSPALTAVLCSDAGCTRVQLCASTRLGCTPVWKVSSHPYSCTDQVIQFVRVYRSNTLKVTPLSHHERRRRLRDSDTKFRCRNDTY